MNLSDISTQAPEGLDKKDIKDKTKDFANEISDLHEVFLADGRHALLIIFQGMDSSGKDGTTSSTFSECSPIGIQVKSFKKPTEEEFAHDFLWRIHKAVPQKGQIVIFNRSHYEDILIQRVHGWISEERVALRMKSINAFEELLQYDNNTTVLKFYLHLSQERQQEKLQERIDMPHKNWKHNANDWEEAKLWEQYRAAYNDVLTKCNHIPWHVIPADQRWYRNYCVAKIVLKTLWDMDLKYPRLSEEELRIEN